MLPFDVEIYVDRACGVIKFLCPGETIRTMSNRYRYAERINPKYLKTNIDYEELRAEDPISREKIIESYMKDEPFKVLDNPVYLNLNRLKEKMDHIDDVLGLSKEEKRIDINETASDLRYIFRNIYLYTLLDKVGIKYTYNANLDINEGGYYFSYLDRHVDKAFSEAVQEAFFHHKGDYLVNLIEARLMLTSEETTNVNKMFDLYD